MSDSRVDGTALIVAAALLAVHHGRRGNDLAAAGFLLFVAGEALILCVSLPGGDAVWVGVGPLLS